MPMVYACLAVINSRFHPTRVHELARQTDAFAPGKALDARTLMGESIPSVTEGLAAFLKSLPDTHLDILRSVYYHALKDSPPRTVTLAWAPAYDHEITVHDAKCGITVMIRSRYPADENLRRGD